jgi:peptidoglycan/xylan/chitin deacetylase (PgdA/CDA1 family)
VAGPLDIARRARSGALQFALSSGLARLIAGSSWRQRRLLILCYHGVSLRDEHEWSDLYVSPDHLDGRLQLLREEGCSVVTLDEGVRRLYDGTLPPRSVAITFDDGMHDFSVRAVPALQKHRLPATLYLTSYYCDYQRPIFDPVVSYLLWRGRGKVVDLSRVVDGGRAQEIPRAQPARDRLHRRILDAAQGAGKSAAEKDAVAQQLASEIGEDYDGVLRERLLHLMSPSEVRSLDPLVDIQLHTHRHRTPRNRELFLRELDDNRRAIDGMRDTPPPRYQHFCYPSGDYAPELLEWLREAGIAWATTCDPQIATPTSHPLLLPRFIDTMAVSRTTFRAWLSGVASLVSRPR